MKRNRFLSIIMIACMLFSSVFIANAAEMNEVASALDKADISKYISEENLNRLKKAGVLDEDILSLAQQIEVYNPTDVQINNYNENLINNRVGRNALSNMPINYEKTKYGDTITPYGIVPYRDLSEKWNPAVISAVSTLSNVINAADQSGVYYCVRSTAGHNQMTSFAQLPSLATVHANDRPYQMFTFSTNNSYTAFGDIGLVYFPATSSWEGFYNVVENGTRYETYDISFSGGSDLYFHIQFYDDPDKAVLTIMDATSWLPVATISYPFTLDCVKSNFSTTQIAKEITLAQHNSGTLNILTGTKMNNAKYTQTYLYTPSTYYSFTSTYCAAAYRQGPTAAAYGKVASTYTAWTSDNVTISFN
nr:hypothetical protein [Sedimentibacter sp.]